MALKREGRWRWKEKEYTVHGAGNYGSQLDNSKQKANVSVNIAMKWL